MLFALILCCRTAPPPDTGSPMEPYHAVEPPVFIAELEDALHSGLLTDAAGIVAAFEEIHIAIVGHPDPDQALVQLASCGAGRSQLSLDPYAHSLLTITTRDGATYRVVWGSDAIFLDEVELTRRHVREAARRACMSRAS